jgi:nitrate reductase assembly molybdenum cofactor insertion protein NarJ
VESQLANELSGDLETFMLTLLRPRIEADVHALYKAMKGFGTDELLITSVLVEHSPRNIAKLKERYQEVHGRDLVEHVQSEVSGDYAAMLMRLLTGPWSLHKTGGIDQVDLNAAEYNATHLYNAGEAQWGTDEATFIAILGSSSDAEIAAIDECYRRRYNKSLARVIKSEFSGDIRKVLMAVVLPPVDRLCFLLHKAMDGAGTNEAVIIQIIGNANKRTLRMVVNRYDEMYEKSLETTLDSEIGGDFGKAVLSYVFADTIGEDIPPENRMVPLDDDVMEYFRKRDTLRKCVYYIAALDATKLRRATKGIGTDELSLTRTICNQTRDGLKRLDDAMVFRYDITLIGLVRSECSGDYCKFLVAIIRDPGYTLAELFRTCVEGWGTDEKLLSELICTSTNQQLQDAQAAYALMFDRSLWRDVASDTSGSYRQLLLALLKGSRGCIGDGWDAQAAATQLYQSGEAKLGTNESTFIAVYALFSQEQLAEIADVYEDISGTSLPDAIANEGFSDDFVELALSLQTSPLDLMCAQLVDRFGQDEDGIAGMFSVLSDAMQADWRVIRTIGALPKNTADGLVAKYNETAAVSLRSAVEERLSGDYAAAVLQRISASPSVGMTDPAVAAMVDQGDEESQPLAEEPTELFLKYDTDGTDRLSYPQVLALIEEEGYSVPPCLDWFDSDGSGDFSQTEFGRLYAVLVHKKAKLEERLAKGLPADEELSLVVLDFDPAFIEPQPVRPPKQPDASMTAEKLTELLNEQIAYIAHFDAAAIKAACPDSLEDDQDTFLSILCDRSPLQRAVLSDHWETNNGQTLAVQIEADRDDGQYKSFINRLIGRAVEEDCKALFEAMDGIGTTQRVLSEILVTRSNAELAAIQECYSAMYDRTLRDHVADEAGGDYGQFLAKLISCERDEDAEADEGLAEEQANQLIKAAKGWGVDEAAFIEVLGGAVRCATLLVLPHPSCHIRARTGAAPSQRKPMPAMQCDSRNCKKLTYSIRTYMPVAGDRIPDRSRPSKLPIRPRRAIHSRRWLKVS